MDNQLIDQPVVRQTTSKAFIEANTIPIIFTEMEKNHIIPVFSRDNEPLISHTDFIALTAHSVSDNFTGEVILQADVRVSHPVKGRIPNARHKSANELEEWEKAIFYERMMFLIEIPSVRETVSGNLLTLTVGGVKSFSEDNLSGRQGADQHFKIFIGFKNQVCTNLCVWTDGLQATVKVKNLGQLQVEIDNLIRNFRFEEQLRKLRSFENYCLKYGRFFVFSLCR